MAGEKYPPQISLVFFETLARRGQDKEVLNRALYSLCTEGGSPQGIYQDPKEMYDAYRKEMENFAKAIGSEGKQNEMTQAKRFCIALARVGFSPKESFPHTRVDAI